MRKTPCRNFSSQGHCPYGKTCKYEHTIHSSIFDPVKWIFSSFQGVELTEFSPEEVRAFYYNAVKENRLDDFVKEHDKLWLNNFHALSNYVTGLEENGTVVSEFERMVDFRKDPGVFIKPFNAEQVYAEIKQHFSNIEREKIEQKGERVEHRPYRSSPYNSDYEQRGYVERRYSDTYRNDHGYRRPDSFKGRQHENKYDDRGKFNRPPQNEYLSRERKHDSYQRNTDFHHKPTDSYHRNTDNFQRNIDQRRDTDYRRDRKQDTFRQQNFHKREDQNYKYFPPKSQQNNIINSHKNGRFSFNKFEDRNNEYKSEKVMYDKYGNVIEKREKKEGLDSFFEAEKKDGFFKK